MDLILRPWLFSLSLATLLLSACGSDDGGTDPTPNPDPIVEDKPVWQHQKLIDLSANRGLVSNHLKVLLDQQKRPNFYYYSGNESEGYDLRHQFWDVDTETLSAAETVINIDNTAGFAVSTYDSQLYSAYQGGGFRDCGDIMSDAMFSVFNGSAWSEYTAGIGFVERNPVLTDGFAGADISLQTDSTGGVHIAYQFFYEGCDAYNFQEPDLLYIHKAAGSFADDAIEQTIEGSELEINNAQNNIGKFNQLILNNDDEPLVFYAAVLADNTQGLRFAYQKNGQWQNEWVETDCDVQGISAALSPKGEPAVAYYVKTCEPMSSQDDFKDGVRYAIKTAEGWQVSMVADKTRGGQYLSLAFDNEGNPAVAYRELETYSGNELKYLSLARFDDQGWASETIHSVDDIGWYNSLWFDDLGTANVVSYSNDNNWVYWFSKAAE